MESDNDSIRLVDVRSPVEFGICHIPGSTSELRSLMLNMYFFLLFLSY